MYSGKYMKLIHKIEPWLAGDAKEDPCIEPRALKYGLKEEAPSDVQKAFKEYLKEVEYCRRTHTKF